MRGPFLVARLAVASVLLGGGIAQAEHHKLTFPEAMARVRAQSPEVVAARARVGEADAGLSYAERWFGQNPEVEAMAGPRSGSAKESTDFELNVTQMLEFGQRGARIDQATAVRNAARFAAEDTVRIQQRAVAIRFFQCLHARERAELEKAASRTATALASATEKRLRRGEGTELDWQRALTAAGLAEAHALSAEASYKTALAELGTLLGLAPPDTLELKGSLEDPPAPGRATNQWQTRGDLWSLNEHRKQALAEEAAGQAERLPGIGLRFTYGQEADDTILRGGLVLTLPFFDRGQELRGAGHARVRRLAAELKAQKWAIERQLSAFEDRYQTLRKMVNDFTENTRQHIDQSERLLEKSFEGGLLNLGDYLLARREILEARKDYLDHLLELALAAVELRFTIGALP